jgi:hypothetical protein
MGPPPKIPQELLLQVQELVRSNRFVEAIKRVREVTQWSLRDAKDAVDAIREGREPPVPRPPAVPELDPATRAAAEALLAQGLLQDAAVVIRDRTGWEMRAVKDAVDALRGAPPPSKLDAVDELDAVGARLAAIRGQVESLLGEGQLIDAIKLVRTHTGMNLAEAKAYVDGLRGR